MQSLIRKSLSLFLSAFAFGSLAAQNPAPPAQRVPESLPGRVTWVIEYARSSKPKGEAPIPEATETTPAKTSSVPTLLRQEISRTPNIRVEKTLWSDQRQTESWIIGDKAYFQPNGSQDFVSGWLDFDGLRHDKDFPDLEWITTSHFSGVDTKDGLATYVYKWTPAQPQATNANTKDGGNDDINKIMRAIGEADATQAPPNSPTTVWIDQKTRWPVAVESNGITRKYSYKMEVSEPLIPPPAVQALVDARKAYLEEARGAKMTRPE